MNIVTKIQEKSLEEIFQNETLQKRIERLKQSSQYDEALNELKTKLEEIFNEHPENTSKEFRKVTESIENMIEGFEAAMKKRAFTKGLQDFLNEGGKKDFFACVAYQLSPSCVIEEKKEILAQISQEMFRYYATDQNSSESFQEILNIINQGY